MSVVRVEVGASDYTYDPLDPAPDIIAVNDTTGARRINLPACTEVEDGHTIDIKDESGGANVNAFTVVPKLATETIQGMAALRASSAYANLSLYNNQAAGIWEVKGTYGTVTEADRPAEFISGGLELWLDAADTSTMTLSSTRVDEWRDKNGGSEKFVTGFASTAYNPLRNSSLFGSRGGVSFSTQFLESDSSAFPLDWDSGWTILFVMKHTTRVGAWLGADEGAAHCVLGVGMGERLGIGSFQTSALGFPRNEAVVAGSWYSGSGNIEPILDGVAYSVSNGSSSAGTGAFGKFQLGAWFPNAGTTNFELAGAVFYSRKLSSIELSSMTGWLKNNYGISNLVAPSFNIVVDGNSLACGYWGQSASTMNEGILAANGSPDQRSYLNVAFGGAYTPGLSSRAATAVDSLLDTSVDAERRICVVWEITNDLAGSQTDTGAYANIKTYCQDRKSAGWKVIVATCLPRTPSGINANFETYRLSVNSSINSNAISEGWADAVADIGGDTTIGQTGDYSNGTYYSDGIHLTDAGHTIAATYITAAINAVTGL